jgi:hypothetical protein
MFYRICLRNVLRQIFFCAVTGLKRVKVEIVEVVRYAVAGRETDGSEDNCS